MGKTIKINKNGSYVVPDGIPIFEEEAIPGEEGIPEKWLKGKKIPCEGGCILCRCGASNAKPFCDGSHIRSKFDGTETAIEKAFKTAVYKGKKLILKDTEELCSLALFCDRAGRIWNLINKSDDGSTKTTIEEACNCPSGRLVLVEKDTGKAIEPQFDPSIGVTRDERMGIGGPLWVKGGIEIESVDGKKYEIRNRVALCRCGCSANKPFCDGSHIDIGFDKN